MNSNPPDQKSERARWMTWARNYVRHWYGQAAVAALAALVCFLSMYSIYLYLSSQLPDGSKIYQKTGLYFKKNWERGPPTATLRTETIFCFSTAFRWNQCTMDISGSILTVSLAKYPNIWGDVEVVLQAKHDDKLVSYFTLEKLNSFWHQKSISDSYFYSSLVFLFVFLGIRHFGKQISKE